MPDRFVKQAAVADGQELTNKLKQRARESIDGVRPLPSQTAHTTVFGPELRIGSVIVTNLMAIVGRLGAV